MNRNIRDIALSMIAGAVLAAGLSTAVAANASTVPVPKCPWNAICVPGHKIPPVLGPIPSPATLAWARQQFWRPITPAMAERRICTFTASHTTYRNTYGWYRLKMHMIRDNNCGNLPVTVRAWVLCKFSHRGGNTYRYYYGQFIGLGDSNAYCGYLGSGQHRRGFGSYGYQTRRNGHTFPRVRLGTKAN